MKKVLALVLCLSLMLTSMVCLFTAATAEGSEVVDADLTAHLRVLYPGTSDLEKEIANDIAVEMKKKYPNVEVEYLSAVVPRQERECAHRSNNHEERSDVIEHLVGTVNGEDFLDEHLQHVGKYLEHAPRTYTHRAKTALEVGADFTLHEDQDDGEDGVTCENADTNQDTLDQYCPEISEAAGYCEEIVEPVCYYTKVKHSV